VHMATALAALGMVEFRKAEQIVKEYTPEKSQAFFFGRKTLPICRTLFTRR